MSARPASRMSGRTAGSRSSASPRSKFPPGEYTIHKPKQCKQLLKKTPIHLKRCTFDEKEVTLALDQNGFCKILVPSTEPTVHPKIMKKSEYEMLMERCYIPTRDEKEKALAAAEKEKDRLLRESMARKESVRKMDLRRSRDKQQGRLTEIEEENVTRSYSRLNAELYAMLRCVPIYTESKISPSSMAIDLSEMIRYFSNDCLKK
ncbi:hypothetical protein QAD02_001223 [Eretmocerus hayati]|uniref:Uncharacterized protein n=1 Tax=Eretmocerus hayati TaxID=131215 RepID=A0ACC2NI13_9HYME|nr:hypothetical protein QAD02_001223 [Eretmocerus hayati]